jgi:hypothetical protein
MNTTLIRTDIWMVAARNYWWAATATGVYFAGGFVLWHGSEGALASAVFFCSARCWALWSMGG